MLRRVPGSRSNITMLVTGTWTVLLLLLLLVGHGILVYVIVAALMGEPGMENISKFTGLHAWVLWLCVAASLAMDVWVYQNIRRDRKKALER